MSNKPLPWFRYYTETHTDIKFTRVARDCKISKAEAVGSWSIILCLAAQSPVRGKLYVTFQERFTVTDVSVSLCFNETKTETLLNTLIKYGMMHVDESGAYCITNWDKRQFEGDVSTDRVRKHREKQAMKREGNVSETPPDTDTELIKREGAGGDTPPPEPPDDFEMMRNEVLRVVGPFQADTDNILAINEMVKIGTRTEDLEAAVVYFRDELKKPIRGPAHMLESVKYNIKKRTQAGITARSNGRNGSGKPKRQERFVEEYGL